MHNHDYKPGDPIEYRHSPATNWHPLGSYLATSGNGSVVCEQEDGQVTYVEGSLQTRLAPDTITITVEIERAGAEAVVTHGGNPAAEDPPARTEAFQAFIDACAKAVES